MRGADEQPGSMFSYVSLEERVPADHPLRAIRRITDRALERLSPRFGTLYVKFGRPSIPPEKLLRALLLQALYTIRSERQLMEQLDYNLLFRWFVGLGMDDAVWSPTTFTKNRDRLLDGDIATAFFEAVLAPCRQRAAAVGRALHRRRHVAGGVGESQEFQTARLAARPAGRRRVGMPRWISGASGARMPRISRRPIPMRGCTRKGVGRPAQLAYGAHLLMENRSGLIVDDLRDARRWLWRTRRGGGDGGRGAGRPRHAGHAKGLRLSGVCRRSCGTGGHAACRAEHDESPERD